MCPLWTAYMYVNVVFVDRKDFVEAAVFSDSRSDSTSCQHFSMQFQSGKQMYDLSDTAEYQKVEKLMWISWKVFRCTLIT